MANATGSIQRLGAAWSDLQVTLGQSALPSVTGGVKQLTGAIEDAIGEIKEWQRFTRLVDSDLEKLAKNPVLDWVIRLADALKGLAGRMGELRIAGIALGSAMEAMFTSIRQNAIASLGPIGQAIVALERLTQLRNRRNQRGNGVASPLDLSLPPGSYPDGIPRPGTTPNFDPRPLDQRLGRKHARQQQEQAVLCDARHCRCR